MSSTSQQVTSTKCLTFDLYVIYEVHKTNFLIITASKLNSFIYQQNAGSLPGKCFFLLNTSHMILSSVLNILELFSTKMIIVNFMSQLLLNQLQWSLVLMRKERSKVSQEKCKQREKSKSVSCLEDE